ASRRYADAGELAEDLRRFQAGEPIRARPVGLLERGLKWVRRNRAVSGGVTVAVLALLLGSGIAIWQAIVAHDAAIEEGKARQLADDEREKAEKLADKEAVARKSAERQRDRAERLLNARTLNLALEAWDADRASDAMNYLTSCPQKLRAWEHDFL